MIATAIHPGITQTGSHPISLIRIECSVKLNQMNRIAAVMTCHEVKLGVIPFGALWSACLAIAKGDHRHQDSGRYRGEEKMQSSEARIEAEQETQHGTHPFGALRHRLLSRL